MGGFKKKKVNGLGPWLGSRRALEQKFGEWGRSATDSPGLGRLDTGHCVGNGPGTTTRGAFCGDFAGDGHGKYTVELRRPFPPRSCLALGWIPEVETVLTSTARQARETPGKTEHAWTVRAPCPPPVVASGRSQRSRECSRASFSG